MVRTNYLSVAALNKTSSYFFLTSLLSVKLLGIWKWEARALEGFCCSAVYSSTHGKTACTLHPVVIQQHLWDICWKQGCWTNPAHCIAVVPTGAGRSPIACHAALCQSFSERAWTGQKRHRTSVWQPCLLYGKVVWLPATAPCHSTAPQMQHEASSLGLGDNSSRHPPLLFPIFWAHEKEAFAGIKLNLNG